MMNFLSAFKCNKKKKPEYVKNNSIMLERGKISKYGMVTIVLF